jgi:hypothetical protein
MHTLSHTQLLLCLPAATTPTFAHAERQLSGLLVCWQLHFDQVPGNALYCCTFKVAVCGRARAYDDHAAHHRVAFDMYALITC